MGWTRYRSPFIAALVLKMRSLCLLLLLLLTTGAKADPYDPLIMDEFFFYSEGETRQYVFKPKWFSRTEVVLYGEKCALPNSIQTSGLKWKIKYQLKSDTRTLEEGYLKERAWWIGGKVGGQYCYKSVSFEHFDSIAYELFPNQYELLLSVEKTDPRYLQASPAMKIGIRKSPVP